MPLWLAAIAGLLLLAWDGFAQPASLPLPAEVAINHAAGRGGLLIVKLKMADGEELPMVLDTGAPGTVLDQSLIPKLGKRLDAVPMNSFDGGGEAGVYMAPKLFIGDVPLQTGTNVFATDLLALSGYLKPPIKGILGMDILRHYCVQLDFVAGKIRFLDPNRLEVAELGRGFALNTLPDHHHSGVPSIHKPGLLGGPATDTVIDTGNNCDGMVTGWEIRRHATGSYSGGFLKRTKHFLALHGWVNHGVGLLGCTWEGNVYKGIAVSRGPEDRPNWIGIRFLARHLVTLDFPHQTLYLKQIRSDPLPPEA